MSEGPKILIADDEEPAIDLVREALSGMPYEVIAARDGEEALQAAQENMPALIILDVQMPKLSGFDVFDRLRADEKLAKIPVIMLTALTKRTGMKFSAKDMGEYMGSQPEAYVDKPIEPIILKQTVQRILTQT